MLIQQIGENASNPVMQRLIARAIEKYADYSKEIFDYYVREKDYIAFYDEQLTQADIEGILAFYKTDAGRSWIRIQPLIVNKMQQAAFQKNADAKARVDRIMKESSDEIREELKKEGVWKEAQEHNDERDLGWNDCRCLLKSV